MTHRIGTDHVESPVLPHGGADEDRTPWPRRRPRALVALAGTLLDLASAAREHALQRLQEAFARLAATYQASVWLYRPGADGLHAVFCYDARGQGASIPRESESSAARAAKSLCSEFWADTDQEYAPHSPANSGNLTRSSLSVPLLTGRGELAAILHLESRGLDLALPQRLPVVREEAAALVLHTLVLWALELEDTTDPERPGRAWQLETSWVPWHPELNPDPRDVLRRVCRAIEWSLADTEESEQVQCMLWDWDHSLKHLSTYADSGEAAALAIAGPLPAGSFLGEVAECPAGTVAFACPSKKGHQEVLTTDDLVIRASEHTFEGHRAGCDPVGVLAAPIFVSEGNQHAAGWGLLTIAYLDENVEWVLPDQNELRLLAEQIGKVLHGIRNLQDLAEQALWLSDVDSVSSAPVREHLDRSREVSTLLIRGQSDLSRQDYSRASAADEMRNRARPVVFELLDCIGVTPPAKSEVQLGGELLAYLTDPDSLLHFARLKDWLRTFRERHEQTPSRPDALHRALAWLVPELVAKDKGVFSHHTSVRLYLRHRLRDFCLDRGLKPADGDLDGAIARLPIAKIRDILCAAVGPQHDLCWLLSDEPQEAVT